jgi:hypothetical protein
MVIKTENALRPRVIGITFLYLALAAMVFFFAFGNLDGRLFWGDEAETAVLARSILHHGVPRVNDGLDHISMHGDQYDARNGIWTWSPWLPHYVTAAAFALFGQTTWAGRAPFALVGWLTVLALGATGWKIYRSHRVALAAMFLLGTSEVFLLHIRQCRYYSLTVFAEILVIYGIYQILKTDRNGAWFVLAGLLLQFYCNYTCAAANVPLLLVLGWNLFRQKKSAALPVIICLGLLFLLCMPWLLYTEFWRQGSAEGHDPLMKSLFFYLVQLQFHFFPWCVVLLPVSGWLMKRFAKRGESPEAPPNTARRLELYLFLLPILYTPVLLIMPGGYSRYLLPVLPALCLLVAVWVFRYVRWTALAVALLVIQCFSNVFAVATDPFSKQYALRWPLADFVFGILLPYEDRFTDVLKYFNQQAHPGDIVVSWDHEFPLMFYSPMRVVNGDLPLPALPHWPDWILPESLSDVFDRPPVPLPDFAKPYYDRIVLTVHNSPRVDNLPEPDCYQSESTKSMSPFIIYKLKARPAGQMPFQKATGNVHPSTN